MGMGKRIADASRATFSALEKKLSGTLKPVAPPQGFVHDLGHRIQAGSRVSLVNHVANWHILALLIAGFITLAMLLAMVARALLGLSGKKRTA
jgi:hypothetical protein